MAVPNNIDPYGVGGSIQPGFIFVITWRRSDGSGSGATCATMDPKTAERLLTMLQENAPLDYRMELTPCF